MSDQTNIKIPSETDNLLARSLIYQFLARLYRHPQTMAADFSWKEGLVQWEEALERVGFPDKVPLADSFQLLKTQIEETPLDQWIRQYESCLGHTVQGPMPAYELEYGQEHTHRQPQQLSDIAAFYRAFGLKINATKHERVDHVGVECEFAHYLLLKEAYALANNGQQNALICREASQRFISEHPSQWIPSFALRLFKHAGEGIMKQTAQFTLLFLTQDCQSLGITPGPNDLPLRVAAEKDDAGCMSCSSQ